MVSGILPGCPRFPSGTIGCVRDLGCLNGGPIDRTDTSRFDFAHTAPMSERPTIRSEPHRATSAVCAARVQVAAGHSPKGFLNANRLRRKIIDWACTLAGHE